MTAAEKFYLSRRRRRGIFFLFSFQGGRRLCAWCFVWAAGFVIVRAFHAALFLCQCCARTEIFSYQYFKQRDARARLASRKKRSSVTLRVYVNALKMPPALRVHQIGFGAIEKMTNGSSGMSALVFSRKNSKLQMIWHDMTCWTGIKLIFVLVSTIRKGI